MLNRDARRRRGERGQALLLALAFIAFFGLIASAVLNYAGTTGLQQVNTERTASRDELAAGGAALAVADASRNARQNLPCTPGGQGARTMQGGDSVAYVIGKCDPRPLANPATKDNCILCLLSTQTALITNRSLLVGGEVAINGSANVAGSLQSPRAIGCAVILACIGTFLPAASVIPAISDPLAGVPDLPRVDPQSPPRPIPSPNYSEDCLTVSPTAAELTKPYALSSGSYCAIDFSKPGQYTLSGGIYAVGGPFVVGGGATVSAAGPVLLYFNCSDAQQDSLEACNDPSGPAAFGSLDVATGGTVASLSPMISGPYAGITIMFDRYNTGGNNNNNGNGNGNDGNGQGNGGVTACGPDVGLCIEGTLGVQGTVYSSAAPVIIRGSGAMTITPAAGLPATMLPGRMVVSSVQIHVNVGLGLNLAGPATSPLCWVYDLSAVTGTAAVPVSPPGKGRAAVEAGCNGKNGVISFTYVTP